MRPHSPARRMEEEGAAHLAERDRRAHRRRPVVVGAHAPAREADLAVRSRGHVEWRAGAPVAAHRPCTRSGAFRSFRTETTRVVPSTTRTSGAGTVSALPSSPRASMRSAGPPSPSGRHSPEAARRRILTVLPLAIPAGRVLSLATMRVGASRVAARAAMGLDAMDAVASATIRHGPGMPGRLRTPTRSYDREI